MRRVLMLFTIFATIALPSRISAQQPRVEASIGAGFGGSNGISSTATPRLGQVYDTLTPVSGASIHLTVGYFITEHSEVEFLWAHQNSRLDAEGSGQKLQVSQLSLYNYMGNFVYNWGANDAKVRPYAFAGVGATQFSFGTNLLQGSSGDIPNDTRFSSDAGGGVKINLSPNLGASAGIRWTPTYITSTNAGIWCDPFYGCWPLANAHYVNQFDTSFAVTLRF
jgi:opacity protein-like surface antigen